MSETILQMLETGRDDLEWFNTNLVMLISKYNNKFIAFSNQNVLESDSNLDKLMLKLKKKGIDTSTVFIEFVSKIKYIL